MRPEEQADKLFAEYEMSKASAMADPRRSPREKETLVTKLTDRLIDELDGRGLSLGDPVFAVRVEGATGSGAVEIELPKGEAWEA